MLQIDRILFPTDFSEPSQQALPYAVALAETAGAELHLLHATVLHASDPANPEHRFPEADALHEKLKERADRRLQEILEAHGTQEARVVTAQRRGLSAPTAILDYAEANAVDLVVLGTHGRRGLRHLMLGSVAEEVTRLAPCPVLTVREAEAPEPVHPFRRILVPVDFSEHSDLALSHALELAREEGGELQLVHAVEELTYPDFYYPSAVNTQKMQEEVRRRLAERLEEPLDRLRAAGVQAEGKLLLGPPARSISDFAEEWAADLIVVGSHGLTGIQRALLGSVAEGIIRRSSVPVMTVKLTGKNLLPADALTGLLAQDAESAEAESAG